jgi:EpsD family peptidyl-prolyl cis-trans isomerase
MLAGCGDKKDKSSSQTAAKVNKEEITVHQINFLLQQQRGLRADQAQAASKQALERLIDQELALQKAEELKLDRDPRVVQQLEAVRREVISRAYVEKLGEAAPKPTPDEIQKYYDDKPALFKERRIYSLQDIAIEARPEQVDELRSALAEAKNIGEFIEFLKSKDYKFAGNQAVRAAEQLPLASLDTIAAMKDGQAVLNTSPTGAQVLVLAGSRSQPVDLERAKPAIEQFLLNERKRDLVAKDIKALRDGAKIVYVGKFAETAASGVVPGMAPAVEALPAASAAEIAAPAEIPAASGLDVKKGLGIK